MMTPGGRTVIERRKGERRNGVNDRRDFPGAGTYTGPWNRENVFDRRIAITPFDRRRAAQHYGDQARIALLEAALRAIITAPIIYTGAIKESMEDCGMDRIQPLLALARAALALNPDLPPPA